ncbi:hypothetical protein CJF30_00011457 [Rutstroemia sp. NJR-2017a BBW]|nr:hypothetical protein CJF30_00011457 [Rutstroemia sp. NJR-2017a BBW]
MTSTSPVTTISITHTLEPYDSISDSSIAYSTDTDWIYENMNMPLEEFCPEIDSFDDDVRSAKAAPPVTASPSKSHVADSTTKLASDLSAAASSPSVPVCAVDNNTINGSEPLPNCLQAPVSGVVADTFCEPGPSPKHSEASGVADDKFIKSEPGEADQPTIATPAQHSLSSFVTDLTEENEGQSTPDRPELREADQPIVVISAQNSLSSAVIELTEESNKQSKALQKTQQVEPSSPAGRRTRSRTSFQEHIRNEKTFMGSSLKAIELMLEENEEDMELVRSKRRRLIELKDHFLAWGAHEEKVTREWEEIV